MERITVNSNCPNCGNRTSEGFACCFDCGEVFVNNAMQLVPAEAIKLTADKDYKTTIALDKIIINLSKKYGKEDNPAYLEWNGGIYVMDGQEPDYISRRGGLNKRILSLAGEGERWTNMINEFRDLKRDLQGLKVEELKSVRRKFNRAYNRMRIGEEERSILDKLTFLALMSVSAVQAEGNFLTGLTKTIRQIKSFI